MVKDREYIDEIIRNQTTFGFYPKEEIEKEVFEIIEDEELEVSKQWAIQYFVFIMNKI